jgi:hypothetical protein
MKDQIVALLSQTLVVLSPVILAGVAWVGKKLIDLINAKVKNEYLRGALARLDAHVFDVVKELQQVEVAQLKEALADGVLSPEEKARLKKTALDKLKSYLGAKGLCELSEVLGFNEGALESFLGTKVESAVHDLRLAETAASSANPTPQPALSKP